MMLRRYIQSRYGYVFVSSMYFTCVCASYVLGIRVAIFVRAGLGHAQAPCGPLRPTMEPASRRLSRPSPSKPYCKINTFQYWAVSMLAPIHPTLRDPTPTQFILHMFLNLVFYFNNGQDCSFVTTSQAYVRGGGREMCIL